MQIVENSFNEAWVKMVAHLLTCPDRDSRAGSMFEETGVSLEFPASTGILTYPGRNMNLSYAAGEFLWYLSGQDGPAIISHYAPSYIRFMEDLGDCGLFAHGAYGKRWAESDQIEVCIEHLRLDSDSRQAVMSMWDPSEDLIHPDDAKPKDIPCTLSIQFLIRDAELECHVTMRSNDVWLGLPYDVFCFTSLQHLFAAELGIKAGKYRHNVGSMHLYQKDYDKVIPMFVAEGSAFASRDIFDFIETPQKSYKLRIKDMLDLEALYRTNELASLEHISTLLSDGSRWTCIVALAAMKNRTVNSLELKPFVPYELIQQLERS